MEDVVPNPPARSDSCASQASPFGMPSGKSDRAENTIRCCKNLTVKSLSIVMMLKVCILSIKRQNTKLFHFFCSFFSEQGQGGHSRPPAPHERKKWMSVAFAAPVYFHGLQHHEGGHCCCHNPELEARSMAQGLQPYYQITQRNGCNSPSPVVFYIFLRCHLLRRYL